MRVSLPSWLSSLRTVSSAQLTAMYAAVAAVVNGNLGRENFAPRAGLGLGSKAAPRAWFALEGQLFHSFLGNGLYGDPTVASNGPSVLRWLVPVSGPVGTKKVGHWTAWVGGVVGGGGSIASGTVELRHHAAGVPTTKDSFAIVNGTIDQALFSRSVVEFEVAPADVLEVRVTGVTYNAPATMIMSFGAAVWLRMPHLP